MSTARTTTPKATKAEAAKAKAEASIKATAEAIVADGLTDEAKVSDAIDGAKTKAEALAAGAAAVSYVTQAEVTSFDAILFGRISIARSCYRAYTLAKVEADAKAEVKAASDLTWTQVANVAFPTACNNKTDYEAMTKDTPRKRPFARSWSSLSVDWSLLTEAGSGGWREAYDVERGERAPSIDAYVTFCRRANAAAKAEAGEKGTKQATAAKTKAAQKAIVDAVKAKVEADAKVKADEAKAKADKAVEHASLHPAANVVSGFDGLIGRDLTSCYDVSVLDAVINAVTAWRDHVKAMSPEDLAAAKGEAAPAAKPDVVTEAAVADVAKADEATVSSDVMAAAAAMLAELMAAKS